MLHMHIDSSHNVRLTTIGTRAGRIWFKGTYQNTLRSMFVLVGLNQYVMFKIVQSSGLVYHYPIIGDCHG